MQKIYIYHIVVYLCNIATQRNSNYLINKDNYLSSKTVLENSQVLSNLIIINNHSSMWTFEITINCTLSKGSKSSRGFSGFRRTPFPIIIDDMDNPDPIYH